MADVKIYTATKTDEVIAQAINSKGLNSVVTDVAVTEDGTGIKVVHSNGTETVVNFPAGGSVEGGLTQVDINSAIDALNLEQYALKSDIPAPQDLAGGVNEAEVRAIVEGMDLGGSGVREVSGTVTLTTADGPLVQVYATAAATVQGEPLNAGDVAVFRLIGGSWEVRVLDVDAGGWRAIGAAPVHPADPDAIVVTAQAPTWKDDQSVGGGTWSVPALEGVTYSPTPRAASPGETITVIAQPLSGYRLSGTSSWTHTFTMGPAIPAGEVSVRDTFTDMSRGVSVAREYSLMDYLEGVPDVETRRTTELGDLQWGAWAVPISGISPVAGTNTMSNSGRIRNGAVTHSGGFLELPQTKVLLAADYTVTSGPIALYLAASTTEAIHVRVFATEGLKVFRDAGTQIGASVADFPTSGKIAATYDPATGEISVYSNGSRRFNATGPAGRTGKLVGMAVGANGIAGTGTLDNFEVTYL